MKHFIVLLTLALLFSPAAHAVSLKQQSIISDDVIRLSDLFYGLNHSEDRVLGAAPRPGQDMVLNARTLMRVAIAMDLPWRPASSADTLIIRREATLVDTDTIEKYLRESIAAEGYDTLYDIRYLSGSPEMVLPADSPATADIIRIDFDADSGFFKAEIAAPSREDRKMQMQISGKIEPMTEVPVLRDTLRAGMVIGARDLKMITVPTHTLNHDVYLNTSDIVGLTPRRLISAGKPLKENQLEEPRIVGRGEPVTMIYNNNGIRLTASGKALENGSKGEVIRVVNMQSSRSIDATVTGTNEVTVQLF